ncbi:MAG: S9 family peptidase [Ferruginibacter sp.]|nr:S9 family peptidase [Ferruginibacter sp.]
MRKIHIVVLFFFMPVLVFAQSKHAITHEDLWLMKRVGAPEISPDGKWVVFSVTTPAYEEKDQHSDLWLSPVDGGKSPRKITNSKAPETAYTWNQDNKTIAFTAKREGDTLAQVYTINITDGGEAQRITNLSTGAAAPKFSPDGSMILFTSRVYPGAFTDSANKKIADEKKKIKYKARVYTSFPIRDWDQWVDEKQAHAFVQKNEPGAEAKDLFVNAELAGNEGFYFNGNCCWTIDGKKIVFTAVVNRNESIYQDITSGIFSVSVNGGGAVQLIKDGFDYTDLAVSSDGKFLYTQASVAGNYKVYNLNKLFRFDYPSMQHKTMLAAELDRPINKFQVTVNRIILSTESEGNDKLYFVTAGETAARPLLNNSIGCYTNISISGNDAIVANYESAAMPAEVVRIDAGNHQFLSQFNKDKLATIDLQPIEIFWFTSSRGKKIRNVLVRPAGFDPTKKYPLFVVMHGGPAGSWKDNFGYRWNYHLLAAPGYVLVLTDYTGSTGYGEKFSQDIQFDPFKGPANEVNEAAVYAIKQYSFIDRNIQAAGGASYGGHLANWLQATTTHYKCLVSHAGLVNSESQWGTSDGIYGREVMNGGVPWAQTKTWKEQNPIHYAEKFKTPILVTVGEQDFRVPLNNSIENWHTLQRMKVPSKLIVFPDENHWILKAENSRFFYGELHSWLKKYMH